MATTSGVKAGLDAISESVNGARQMFSRGISQIVAARNQLAAIPTTHADTIATIDGFTPTGPFETLAKDEKDKLASEFLALKSQIESALDDLGVGYP